VRDMLTGLENTTVVRPSDVDAMAVALRARIAAAPEPDVAPPARYARRRSVERIGHVLDAVLPDHTSGPLPTTNLVHGVGR